MLRLHRIDLNVLVDHDPEEFIAHVDTFVRQLANVDHINLFLSSISNDDIIAAKFPNYHPTTNAASSSRTPAVTRPGKPVLGALATVAENSTEGESSAEVDAAAAAAAVAALALQASGGQVDESLKINRVCTAVRRVLTNWDRETLVRHGRECGSVQQVHVFS